MREFLLLHFGTTKVQNVDIEDLKAKLDGPSMISRINYRKQATKFLHGQHEVMNKG